MQAVVLKGPRDLDLEEVADPRPGTNEVLCRVESIAICGTDIHILEGRHVGRWPPAFPFIMGHEWAGTVVELGPGADVFGWRVGDRVAGTSHSGCGFCRMCRIGRYNLCERYGDARVHRQYGHTTQGCYAQYVVHSIKSLVHLPDALSFDEGAVLDPASIALWTAKRAQVNAGDTVAVLGPGPVGLLTAYAARALGAGRVLVVGGGERLDVARSLGFETIDRHGGPSVEQVREATGGRGPEVAIDCAGTPEAIRQCVDMVRKGGRVVFTAVPHDEVAFPMQRIVLEELDLVGVRANRSTLEEVVPLVLDGRVPVGRLITHRFPLSAAAEAIATFQERRDGALEVLMHPWLAPAGVGGGA
jgi:L-iditol 2-dehydrogenase